MASFVLRSMASFVLRSLGLLGALGLALSKNRLIRRYCHVRPRSLLLGPLSDSRTGAGCAGTEWVNDNDVIYA